MASVIRSLQKLVCLPKINFNLNHRHPLLFHQFIAEPISLSKLFEQAVEIIISASFWLIAIFIIRRFRSLIAQRVGDQAATIIEYLLLAIAILVMTFGILNILEVSADSASSKRGNHLSNRRSDHFHIRGKFAFGLCGFH